MYYLSLDFYSVSVSCLDISVSQMYENKMQLIYKAPLKQQLVDQSAVQFLNKEDKQEK